MRLHNFFIDQEIGEKTEVVISDAALLAQWIRVLRLRVGDIVIMLDNSGFQFAARIEAVTSEEARLTIQKKEKNKNVPRREVTLFQSLIKKDKLEWVFEKGTELGVAEFTPILSERSEKKSLNYDRSRKIIKEAAEQSGRGMLPVLDETVPLEEVLNKSKIPLVVFHTEGEKIPHGLLADTDPVGALVGPEGGWSEREIALFGGKEIPVYSFGSPVLRAETAAIAVTTVLLLNY